MQVVSAKGLLALLLLPLIAATLHLVVPSQVVLEAASSVLVAIFLALARATFRVTRSRIRWSALIFLSVAALAGSAQLGSRQQGQLPTKRLELFLIISFLVWAKLNLVTIVLRPGAPQQALAASRMPLFVSRQSCRRSTLLIRVFVEVKLRVGMPTTSRL